MSLRPVPKALGPAPKGATWSEPSADPRFPRPPGGGRKARPKWSVFAGPLGIKWGGQLR